MLKNNTDKPKWILINIQVTHRRHGKGKRETKNRGENKTIITGLSPIQSCTT